MQVVRIGDGGVVRGADGHRHRRTARAGHPDLHRPDAVAHPVDIGVRVTGRKLGQDDLRIRRHLTGLAHGDDGVLVVGRLRNLVETSRQERDRETGSLVEAAVETLLAVVGDADPDDRADDADHDRGRDGRCERDAGPQGRGAPKDPRQQIHRCCPITAFAGRTPPRARYGAGGARRWLRACGAGIR